MALYKHCYPRLVNKLYRILVNCEDAPSYVMICLHRGSQRRSGICNFSLLVLSPFVLRPEMSSRKCSINSESSFFVLPLIQLLSFTHPTIFFKHFICQMSKSDFLSLFSCLLSFFSSVSCFEGLSFFCSPGKIASMFDLNKK